MKKDATLLWILAVVMTLAVVFYQRYTGPTHPVRGSVDVNGEMVKYRFIRNHDTTAGAEITVPAIDGVAGRLEFRRFRSHDEWASKPMKVEDGELRGILPRLDAAGKVQYRVHLAPAGGKEIALTEEPVILRYKDPVPGYFLIPHILLMFAGMLWGMRAGLEAIVKGPSAYRLTVWTASMVFAGGLILGPIVQKYAFGAFWTGWPLGQDLTDTKTLGAMLFWLVPLWFGRGGRNARLWIIMAVIVTVAIYLIPHSVLGSELDYTKLQGP